MSKKDSYRKNTQNPKRVPLYALGLKNSRGNVSDDQPLDDIKEGDVLPKPSKKISNQGFGKFYYEKPHYCNPKNHDPNCPNRKPKSMVIIGGQSGCGRNSGCSKKNNQNGNHN